MHKLFHTATPSVCSKLHASMHATLQCHLVPHMHVWSVPRGSFHLSFFFFLDLESVRIWMDQGHKNNIISQEAFFPHQIRLLPISHHSLQPSPVFLSSSFSFQPPWLLWSHPIQELSKTLEKFTIDTSWLGKN